MVAHVRRRGAKVLAAKRILTALCHCGRAQQSPRQPILGTDLTLLQGWLLGALGITPTLGPKIGLTRSQVTGYSESGRIYLASRLRTGISFLRCGVRAAPRIPSSGQFNKFTLISGSFFHSPPIL
jgi:hypothetical protein